MTKQENVNRNTKSMMQRILAGFIISLSVVIVGGLIYLYIRTPKTSKLSESKNFAAEKVYEESEAVISLFEAADYTAIRENYCNEDMAAKMMDEALETAVASLGDDWGARVEIESKEGFEAKQSNKYYAMTQYKVTYENTKLTYTIMFDMDMKLAGFSVEPQ